jgi:amidase
VRYPAYCTGVAGLRPSFGRVPAFLPSAKDERPLAMSMMSVQGLWRAASPTCDSPCRR